MIFRAVLIILLTVLVPSALLVAGVKETKHNFASSTYSPNAYFVGVTQTCVFCHTAHGGDQATAPLWNHENTTYTPYQTYDSPTIQMTISQPHTGSLICLTCHDGTIAINSLNNLPGPSAAGNYGSPGGAALDGSGRLTSASDAFVGTDLADDHPVGVTYDASQDPTGFVPKTGTSTNYPDKLLYNGLYVECSSCHNPHDNTNSNFLVESNSGSQLCLRCHTK